MLLINAIVCQTSSLSSLFSLVGRFVSLGEMGMAAHLPGGPFDFQWGMEWVIISQARRPFDSLWEMGRGPISRFPVGDGMGLISHNGPFAFQWEMGWGFTSQAALLMAPLWERLELYLCKVDVAPEFPLMLLLPCQYLCGSPPASPNIIRKT